MFIETNGLSTPHEDTTMTTLSVPTRRFRFVLAGFAAIAMSAAFAAPSYACDVGESYCNGGSLYVCQCWTTTGCSYEYSGVCENLALNFSPAPHAKPAKFIWRHV